MFRFGRSAAPSSEACEVVISGRVFAYRLRRSVRRSLALRVDDRGVQVSAPLRITQDEIERFLRTHADWLAKRLGEREARAEQQAFVPEDGVLFPLGARTGRLRLESTPVRPRWQRAEDGVEELVLGEAADVRERLVRALRHRALPLFDARVAVFCSLLGLEKPVVRLTSARTRWGSCSRVSGIRLHWRLIHVSPDLLDYVVAHEVAHLIEMNHSPRFWTIVERLYPAWRSARRSLSEVASTLPAIDVRDVIAPHDL